MILRIVKKIIENYDETRNLIKKIIKLTQCFYLLEEISSLCPYFSLKFTLEKLVAY